MTGKTHRLGGVLGCLIGYSVLLEEGLLIEDVNPLLQLAVMYPYSIYGSTVLDLDHDWDSAPSKDIISWFIWRVLHLTTPIRKWLQKGKIRRKVYQHIKSIIDLLDSKHRSWQTHSDLTLIFSVLISMYLFTLVSFSTSITILSLISQGLLLGIISHLLLDLITPTGIWSFILTPISLLLGKKGLAKIHLVPESSFFATDSDGSPWERLIRKVVWLMCFIFLMKIIYLFSPYRVVFDI